MPTSHLVPAARPRPLRELPDDLLAPVRGVLTDIDDTLTRDGAIEPAALAALRALASAGIPVVAITGRPAGWSEPFAMAWPVAAIVAENGGVMLRRQDGELSRAFTVGEDVLQERSARLKACAAALLADMPGISLAQDSPGRITDIAVDHSEFAYLDPPTIDRVVQGMRAHGLTATVSSIHVNGWLGAHSKWTAARWAVEQALGLAFDAGEWVYVGDSTNDQLMFEHCPISIAVANVRRFLPALTVLPAFVTPGERGVGFAEVASRVLAATGAHAGRNPR